jgi:hypothetical protein
MVELSSCNLQGLLTPFNESLCLSRWLLAGATLKIQTNKGYNVRATLRR